MYQSVRVVERGVKQREREELKFLIQVLLDVTPFQLVKGDWPEKRNYSNFTIKQNKKNGFLCSKLG
jgi:hypothetical protein